jgi:uncharacterized protein (TIGR00369 family)
VTFSPVAEPVVGSFGDPAGLRLSGVERFSPEHGARRFPPPIHYLTGLTPTAAELGTATFELPVSAWLQGPAANVLSSGVLAFAADAPLSGAIATNYGPGTAVTTSQLSLNFVAAGTLAGGAVRVRGETIHAGRRQGLAEARVEDQSGRLLAHGTTRCVVLELGVPPEGGPPPDTTPPADFVPVYQRPLESSPVDPEQWRRRTGLEIVRRIMTRDLPPPPLGQLLGARLVEATDGAAALTMPATGWLCPPAPALYGGALALFADIALANALLTTLPAGSSYATLDLVVYFIRPVFPDGSELRAAARVVHRGRSFAVVEGEMVNGEGKPVIRATMSAMVLNRPFAFGEESD